MICSECEMMTSKIILQFCYGFSFHGNIPPLRRGHFSIHVDNWMLFPVEFLGEYCPQASLGCISVHKERLGDVWFSEHLRVIFNIGRLVWLLQSIVLYPTLLY